VYYAVFHDGPQMVLIFSDEESIFEAVSDVRIEFVFCFLNHNSLIPFSFQTSALGEPISQYIQISIRDIGISVVNDVTRDDLFYITINKSRQIWTEKHKSVVRPLSSELNHDLERHYKTHNKHHKANANDKRQGEKIYHISRHRVRFLVSLSNHILIYS
jgi:hypothetical protein